MIDHEASMNEIDEYINTLTDAEREALNAASVALDVAGLVFRARSARGFTQAEAAEASGLKQQAISRIEGGTINVTVRMLERYLCSLQYTLSLHVIDQESNEEIDVIDLNLQANVGKLQHLVHS